MIAPAVALLGMTNTVRVVPFLFLIATSYVLWRAFVNTPYKDTMRLAMATLWIWPAFTTFTSLHVTGFVSVVQLLVACIFACAYYAAHSLRNLRYFYLWAFLSGLLLWTYPLAIFAIVTFTYWIFASAPVLKKKTLPALGLFVLGSLPFWISVISNNFTPLIRMHDEAAGHITDTSTNSWYAFLQFLGARTFTNNNMTSEFLSPVFVVLYVVALLGLVVLIWMATTRIKKLKTTDFAYLHMLIIGIYTLVGAILFAFSQNVDAAFYVVLAIPIAFVVLFARDSKVTISIGLMCFFVVGTLSLFAANEDANPKLDRVVSSVTAALKKSNTARAVAPHSIAYIITAKSDNTIIVTPLNGNNFDAKRSRKVERDLHAIVVEANNLPQQSVALCAQAQLDTAFERVEAGSADIYIVEKKFRSRAFDTLNNCIKDSIAP